MRTCGILSPLTEKELNDHLRKIESGKSSGDLRFNRREILTSIARGLEIKRIYESTHHIFAHAQSAGHLVITYTLKQLARKISSPSNLSLFKYLRDPSFDSPLTIPTVPDQELIDHSLNQELLSADAYFFSSAKSESAMDFLSCNRSIWGNPYHLSTLFQKLLQKEDFPEWRKKTRELVDLVLTVQKIARCGIYYIICIPKDQTEQIAYRAHPGGRPCTCYEREKDINVIEKLNHNILDTADQCVEDKETGIDREIPQFRLLTSKLKPENGVLIFSITPFSQTFRRDLKHEISKILSS